MAGLMRGSEEKISSWKEIFCTKTHSRRAYCQKRERCAGVSTSSWSSTPRKITRICFTPSSRNTGLWKGFRNSRSLFARLFILFCSKTDKSRYLWRDTIQEAQAGGCRTSSEAERFIGQKRKKEDEENALRSEAAAKDANSRPAPISSSVADMDLMGFNGADLLSEAVSIEHVHSLRLNSHLSLFLSKFSWVGCADLNLAGKTGVRRDQVGAADLSEDARDNVGTDIQRQRH